MNIVLEQIINFSSFVKICSFLFTIIVKPRISYMYDYENLLKANIPLDRKSLCTGKQVTVENINSAVDQIGKLYDDTAKSTASLISLAILF
jgi:hypothetical protein